MSEFSPKSIRLHGHDVTYRMAGKGPAIVLLHGVTGSSTTWKQVMPDLAKDHLVVAPDLLGHGESAKPRGDYSLGAYASGVRDLLVALGVERATFVGHSLGGGVAMQLAYQFPDRVERLVLVASGGLGRGVSPLLRAATLPGSELVLGAILDRRIQAVGQLIGNVANKVGLRLGSVGTEVWRSYTTLTDRPAQGAFISTVRSVIDLSGQRVSANDRLYLAAAVPTMIVWGDRDRIIPVAHAHAAHEAIPHSRLEIIERAGHFLPFERGAEFLRILRDFLATSEPAHADEDAFRQALLNPPV
jgi:pimeloyl-ACP methyl ester carboxylesterase